jgi:hypothetical protein
VSCVPLSTRLPAKNVALKIIDRLKSLVEFPAHGALCLDALLLKPRRLGNQRTHCGQIASEDGRVDSAQQAEQHHRRCAGIAASSERIGIASARSGEPVMVTWPDPLHHLVRADQVPQCAQPWHDERKSLGLTACLVLFKR